MDASDIKGRERQLPLCIAIRSGDSSGFRQLRDWCNRHGTYTGKRKWNGLHERIRDTNRDIDRPGLDYAHGSRDLHPQRDHNDLEG